MDTLTGRADAAVDIVDGAVAELHQAGATRELSVLASTGLTFTGDVDRALGFVVEARS